MASLREISDRIGARIVTTQCSDDTRIDSIYVGNTISRLLTEATDRTLLVTGLRGAHLIRVAELLDVPGICLLDGAEPGASMMSAANERGTLLMVSSLCMREVRERLAECVPVPVITH